MTRFSTRGLAFSAAILSLCAYAAPASAQATRTWVSGVGDDVNPCSRTAPCKTFAGAISKTAAGGEINCLDPGGYGTLTITKSITIDCIGTNGSVLTPNTTGFIVNGAGAIVNLRNVTINGAAGAPNVTGSNGIRILAAAAVNVDNVTIENMPGSGTTGKGISIETGTNVEVNVTNSRISNTANHGIHSNPTAGTVVLTVRNVIVDHSSGGSAIQLRQNTTATIDHSQLTHQAVGGGVVVELTSVTAHVSNSVLANNLYGVFNGNGGSPTTRLYANVITGNLNSGLLINSGSVISYGNNAIRGNVGNEAPTGTAIGTQ